MEIITDDMIRLKKRLTQEGYILAGGWWNARTNEIDNDTWFSILTEDPEITKGNPVRTKLFGFIKEPRATVLCIVSATNRPIKIAVYGEDLIQPAAVVGKIIEEELNEPVFIKLNGVVKKYEVFWDEWDSA